MNAELTMIPVKKTTRAKLRSIGRKSETYNQIIQRLIDGEKSPEAAEKGTPECFGVVDDIIKQAEKGTKEAR